MPSLSHTQIDICHICVCECWQQSCFMVNSPGQHWLYSCMTGTICFFTLQQVSVQLPTVRLFRFRPMCCVLVISVTVLHAWAHGPARTPAFLHVRHMGMPPVTRPAAVSHSEVWVQSPGQGTSRLSAAWGGTFWLFVPGDGRSLTDSLHAPNILYAYIIF
jgi:hypothetical protein